MNVFKKDVTSKQLVGIELFSVNTRKGNIPKKIILKISVLLENIFDVINFFFIEMKNALQTNYKIIIFF